MLKDIFFALTREYADDVQLIQKLWAEIEKHYSGKDRHYHTLSHLEDLISHLSEVKKEIVDWNILLFAMFYHDIIYKVTKGDNEERSAELAHKRLGDIAFPAGQTSKCTAIIMATKDHLQSGDTDTDFFIDADLSILGQSWDRYAIYLKQIRQEYSIYPDIIYKPGRKKVLNHFLQMDRIYKSHYFYDKFETQARKNLLRESESL